MPRAGFIHPITWEDGVMPLSEFPAHKQREIAAAVARRSPPPRWIGGDLWRIESRAWSEWHWSRGLRLRKDPNHQSPRRRRIPDAVRLAVYERDGFECLHCGSVENLTLDHIHPHSHGGGDALENLQTLCQSCNSRKGARV